MAFTLVQHKFNTGAGTSVSATISAIGAGNPLLVGVFYITGTTPTISDGTNTYTLVPGSTGNVPGATVETYVCLNPTGGPTTITLGNITAGGAAIHFHEYSGFTSAAIDQANANSNQTTASSTNTGASVTTAQAAGIGMSTVITTTAITVNPKVGSVWTAGGDIDAFNQAACSLIFAASGTYIPTWTDTNGATYGTSVVLLKNVSATPPYTGAIVKPTFGEILQYNNIQLGGRR